MSALSFLTRHWWSLTFVALCATLSVSAKSETVHSIVDMSYDSSRRPVCTAQRMNPATWQTVTDACTSQAVGADGPDRISRTVYDQAGRVVQIRQAVGTAIEQAYATYSYSPNGHQTAIVDANGNRATFSYDGFDRIERWTFPLSGVVNGFTFATPATALATAGPVNPADYEAYTYDANGNRLTLQKRDGSILSFQYDALNRVVRKTVPERTASHPSPLPPIHTRDVFYRYDLRGLQIGARFDSLGVGPSCNPDEVCSRYDGMGRLTQSIMTMDGVTRTISYQWLPSGLRSGLTHPDGTQVSYSYDGLNRAVEMRVGTGTATITPVQWGYTARGELETTQRPGVAAQPRGYDLAGRMTSLGINVANTSSDNGYGFTFNPAQQIASRSQSNDAFAWTAHVSVNRSYAPNGLNQYGAVTTGEQTSTFQHDMNGNLTSDGSAAFVYDVENRLVSAQGATLRYDPLGRLYEVADIYGAVRFLYDGDALVGEYKASGRLLRRYLHGVESGDDPLVWFEGVDATAASMRHLLSDERGSVVGVTDSAGNMLIVNSYDEYGIPAPTNAGRFQYTGQAWLPELGLYHYKARVYSPTLGRFLQTDPIGYEDQQNLYGYVGNDPINSIDPDGLDTVNCTVVDNSVESCVVSVDNEASTTLNIAITNTWIDQDGVEHSSTNTTSTVIPGSLSNPSFEQSLLAAFGYEGVRGVIRQNLSASVGYDVVLADSETGAYSSQSSALPPAQSPYWRGLQNYRGAIKTDGNNYYTYDRRHGEIEMFDRRGNHLGTRNAQTGQMEKPPVPGRRLDGL